MEAKRKRILLVDDEPALLRIVHTALKIYGYEVAGCTSAAEALEKLLESFPASVARVASRAKTAPLVDEKLIAEARKRSSAALKQATDVPMRCCHAAREVIDLGAIAADKGNLNVISDAGVGVLAAYAALRSAALNVFTNARMINDKTFAEAKLKELNQLLAGAEAATEKAYGTVKGKVS